jgi:hypothetical protein
LLLLSIRRSCDLDAKAPFLDPEAGAEVLPHVSTA